MALRSRADFNGFSVSRGVWLVVAGDVKLPTLFPFDQQLGNVVVVVAKNGKG